MEELSARVAADLALLDARATAARHAAAGVRISVAANGDAGCVRSYRANLTSGMSNEVSVVMGVAAEEDTDGMIAYLPGGGGKEGEDSRHFLALEMVDRKIRYFLKRKQRTIFAAFSYLRLNASICWKTIHFHA